MKKGAYLCLIMTGLIVIALTAGCGGKIPHMLAPDYKGKGARLVAVLPVINKTTDAKAGQILRESVLEELYFKGYPKIPLDVIDSKLSQVYQTTGDAQSGVIPPGAVGELTGADAVMYCTLENLHTSYTLFWARTKVSVDLELRSAKTGETLWRVHYGTTERNYDISRKDLEMKAYQVYEPALDEALNKAMATLPDGPDTIK